MSQAQYSCVLVRAILCAALVLSAAPVFAQTVAAGAAHVAVAKSDGTVWSVGNNDWGQLGDNTQTGRLSPVQATGVTDVVAVAAGSLHTMALTSTGNLYSWGYNAYGQLGDGTTTMRKTAVQSSLSNVVAIAAVGYHSAALLSNGDVYVWGRNAKGESGPTNAGVSNTLTPVQLTTSGAAISVGLEFTMVVKTNGTVYGIGENSDYQLGDGTNTDRTSLVQMSSVSTATGIATGEKFTVVLLSTGTLKAVGYDGYGNLGDGGSPSGQRTSLVTVPTVSSITAIFAGTDHVIARKSDGTVWAWGRNHAGQVGNAALGTDAMTPVQVSALSSISAISANSHHSMAVTSGGVVSTWGANAYSQLGEGTTLSRATPTPISDAGYDWKASMPTLSISGGTYSTSQTVTVAVTMSGATIRYTQNGSEPTASDSSVTSGSSVSVSTSQTLKVKVFKSGMPASNTVAEVYELKVATAAISPASGTYTSARTVTMSTSTSGATVRYTLDGSTPTTSSTAYSSAITVGTSTVVKGLPSRRTGRAARRRPRSLTR